MTADLQTDVEEKQLELLPAPKPDVPERDGDSNEKSDTKSLHLDENASHTVFTNATSFEELEAEQEAKKQAREVRNDAALVPQMVNNIMFSAPDDERESKLSALGKSFMNRITDAFTTKQAKPTKTEGGVKFPASDFAFTPDRTKPSTWKLRLATERPGNITVKQLGRAAAAFSSGGFRGNRVQIPSADIPKVKARIRREYSKLGVKPTDIPKSVKEQSLMFWKEGNTIRWFAVYSNNYRDEDNPPEIIAAQSHERFVKMVDSGDYPMPVLQHYHVPGTEWGQADWVSYDKDTGFMMASGYVLPGHEKEAETIEQMENIILSHGMPRSSIKRDKSDSTIIIEHQTEEISDLPFDVAANKLTSFEIFNQQKDTNMSIPQQKKDYLLEVGLDEDKITNIEQSLEAKKESAMAQELESKDKDGKETQEDVKPEAAPEPKVETKTEDKPTKEPTPVAAFNDEQTKEFAEFTTAFRASLLKDVSELITTALTPLTDAIKEQSKSDADRLAQMPPASLSDIILGGNVLKTLSATEADETKVDKRTKESKDGPVQTEVEEKSILNSGDPFFDSIIPDLVNGTPIEEIKV